MLEKFGFLLPVALLAVSNIFMTFAWYGHLKFPHIAIWAAILISWGIALVEYCFAIPANRIGSTYYSLAELKTIQEVMILAVFVVVSAIFFGEKFTLAHGIGFSMIAAGAVLIFHAKNGA